MIHYQLRCDHQHEFDGWFKNSAAFEAQAAGGLIECPTCGDRRVTRALMAPSLGKHHPAASSAPVSAPDPVSPAPRMGASGPIPDHVRAMLQRIRSEVEKSCDYVGQEFAEEARRIHRGESERRGIYGETTPGQAESLADEGIEVARIPWVPRAEG